MATHKKTQSPIPSPRGAPFTRQTPRKVWQAALVGKGSDQERQSAQRAFADLMLEDALCGKVSELGEWGMALLSTQARNGRLKAVRSLIAAGVPVTSTDQDGMTPLMHAAVAGKVGLVKELVAAGSELDAQANDGWTALDCASEFDNQDAADFLSMAMDADCLIRQASVLARDGTSPASDAFLKPISDIVLTGVSDVAEPVIAVIRHRVGATRTQPPAFVVEWMERTLTQAAESDNLVGILRCADAGMDMPWLGNARSSALCAAASAGKRAAFEHLRAIGARFEEDDPAAEFLLSDIYAKGDAGLFESALVAGAPQFVPDEDGDTVLHLVARDGNMEFAAILAKNAGLHSRLNLTDETPAQVARSSGHNDIAALIERTERR